MKVKLKKKILKICLIIVFTLTIASLFVNKPKEHIERKNISVATMSMNRAGSISLEENDYFKKYSISCLQNLEKLNYNETDKEINLTLDRSQISNIDINSIGKVNFSEIKAKNNKNEYTLTFKKLYKNENYVHVDSYNNHNILIMISKKENPYKYKVAIDPGHGGNDVGAKSGKIFEKDLTLKISLYMEDNFRYNGCEPIYTRKTDKWVDYKTTPKFANDLHANAFVSVHINSSNEKSYSGVATYYYDPSGYDKEERIKLAKSIQGEIIKNDNWKDRGIIRENFLVIRQTEMPSALVECGFIVNDGDMAKLLKDETLRNLGRNISNGVINYLSQKH